MNKLAIKTKNMGKKVKEEIMKFWNDESGMRTVEVILIIVVLIGLVIVFKTQISQIVDDIFSAIREETRVVTG